MREAPGDFRPGGIALGAVENGDVVEHDDLTVAGPGVGGRQQRQQGPPHQ